jgi:hypothetical protein
VRRKRKKAFQEYSNEDKAESTKFGMTTMSIDHQSHYNTKIKKCLMLLEKQYSSGNRLLTSIFLFDAFERRQYATWMWGSQEGKKYWEVLPMACELAASYQQKKFCTTREEFDSFVAGYMEE